MEPVHYTIPCPKCGNLGFNQPDNAGRDDLANGRVACTACGHVLTVEDVAKLKADMAASRNLKDPVNDAVAQAVRDILK